MKNLVDDSQAGLRFDLVLTDYNDRSMVPTPVVRHYLLGAIDIDGIFDLKNLWLPIIPYSTCHLILLHIPLGITNILRKLSIV